MDIDPRDTVWRVWPYLHRAACEVGDTPQPVRDSLPSNAVRYVPAARDAAAQIKGFVAFWKGVTVED